MSCADSGSGPKCEIHLQLLGALVRDQFADVSLLLGCQAAALAAFLAALLRLERRHAARLVKVDRHANRRPAQIRQFDNLHHAILLLMQTDDLFAPLMQFSQALVSGIVIAHAKTMNCFASQFTTSSCRIK